ncbi:MAG: hypothetical protein ACRDVM_01710, partial [Acidimicrobiia bacterium]
LEQRRSELLAELETVRASIARMEEELDTRREELELPSEPPPEEGDSVGVVRSGTPEPDAPDWEPGETVRIVPREVPPAPVDALEMADEVRRLREPSGLPAAEGKELAEDEPAAPAGEVAVITSAVEEELGARPADDLADLFRMLRRTGEPASQDGPSDRPSAQMEPPSEVMPARPPSQATLGVDLFALRDRLILPVTNRALRNLKRQLTEEQNAVLEELRLSEEDWAPDRSAVEERLRADLTVLFAESFAAGHAALEELLGRPVGRPPTPFRDLAPLLAGPLCEALDEVLEEGRGSDQGPRRLSSAVSRVFRAWRTDEAARRAGDLAHHAYHRGLVMSLATEGRGAVSWVVAGRGCASCRAARESGRIDLAVHPSPELPPIHSECGCTIVPER